MFRAGAVAGGGEDHVANRGFVLPGDFGFGVFVDVYGVDDNHVGERKDCDELTSGAASCVSALIGTA